MDTAVDNDQSDFLDALEFNANAGGVLKDYISSNIRKFAVNLPILGHALNAMVSSWYTQDDMQTLKNLISSIAKKLPSAAQKYFADATTKLQKNIYMADKMMFPTARWIYDNYVPVKRIAWTKPLTDVNAKNISYQLTFEPHYPVPGYDSTDGAKDYTFDGHVTIEFKATNDIQKITLNSHRQLISSISLPASASKIIKMEKDYDNGILTLTLSNRISSGRTVTIDIDYIGFIFNKDLDQTQGVSLTGVYNPKIGEYRYS